MKKTIVQEIDEQIAELQMKKFEIQEVCSHPGHKRIQKSNTGNWDYRESYWTECECSFCGKHWVEDKKELYGGPNGF